MNKLVLGTLLLALSPAALAAAVFECTDASGRTVYTQSGGQNCKRNDLGRPSVYSSSLPSAYSGSTGAAAAPATETQALPNPEEEAARSGLEQAKKNLEEGKKVRYGNERNYARYLERIQGLENQVKAAQEKVNAASSSQNAEAQYR